MYFTGLHWIYYFDRIFYVGKAGHFLSVSYDIRDFINTFYKCIHRFFWFVKRNYD